MFGGTCPLCPPPPPTGSAPASIQMFTVTFPMCCSGIECADCVMNLDQYRAVTKTELDIADHSDADRAGDNGETLKLLVA